jgi:hypothetical protein
VLLNTHVMTMANMMAASVNKVMPLMPPPPEERPRMGPGIQADAKV